MPIVSLEEGVQVQDKLFEELSSYFCDSESIPLKFLCQDLSEVDQEIETALNIPNQLVFSLDLYNLIANGNYGEDYIIRDYHPTLNAVAVAVQNKEIFCEYLIYLPIATPSIANSKTLQDYYRNFILEMAEEGVLGLM